jgi:hypothetical protein
MKVIGILLFTFALPALAQEHQHSSEVINGYEHPDQISDSDAYRLFFLIPFPKEPGGEEREKIISAFRLEWDSSVAQYNAKATALNKAGKRADVKQFLADRDALVEQTRKELAQALPEKSIDELDRTVQQLKQWMAVSGGLQTSNDPCVTYSNNIAVYWGMWPGGGGLSYPFNAQLADWNNLPDSMRFGIILDGAAIMTINPSACGQRPDISAITHTPELSVKLDENPASQKGSAICADCYINAVMTETHSTTVGTQVDFSPEAVIHCSYGGDIF